MKRFRTEDEIRDEAKCILGLENTETALSGTGQITAFNQLGFTGISDKPDGWYLPNEIHYPAIILETKGESRKFTDSDRDELIKNCRICHNKYKNVIGLLYNGNDLEVYKNEVKIDVNDSLLNKEVYLNLFNQERIDKKAIFNLTKKINDILHFEFGINNLYHRMIFTSCALVAKRFGAILSNKMSWDVFQTSIKATLKDSLRSDIERNSKLNILIDTYSNIRANKTPKEADIAEFMNAITDISDKINSDFWNGEDVMAIFFNEFTRYKGKSEQGQVFTPDHITSLMYRLIEVDQTSFVLDAACGSGSFLIKSMCNMIKEAGGIRSAKAEEIKDGQLFGIEWDKEIYALACANMLIHKDGKTNLANIDARTTEAGKWIASHNINKVLMNPPFENKYGCLDIVLNVLDNVTKDTLCAFILPDNKLEKNSGIADRILKKHRLEKIIKLPKDTFQNIGVTTSIFIFRTGVPQKERKIFACYIQDDGLETVKNQGRQDTKNRWKEIEDYWVDIILRQQGDDSIQWLNSGGDLKYKEAFDPIVITESDFTKSVLHHILYEKGIDEKDFKEHVLNMVLYNEDIPQDYKKFIISKRNKVAIDTSTWKEFKYKDLFEIKKGVRLTKAEMSKGHINYIGASAFNNGVTQKISNDSNIHCGNTITVCYNGSIGAAFYQENEFWASDDVNVFYPKFAMDKYIGLFLTSLIRKEGGKYRFLDKWTREKMKETSIMLPCTKDGAPDFKYMKNFIKDIYKKML